VVSELVPSVAAAGLGRIANSEAVEAAALTLQAIDGDTSHRDVATSDLEDLQGTLQLRHADAVAVVQQQAHIMSLIFLVAILTAGGIVVMAALWVRASLFRRYRDMSQTANRIIAGSPERLDARVRDPLGAVAAAFNTGIDRQRDLVAKLEHENRRGAVSRQIVDALEMATDRQDVYDVARVAIGVIHGPVGVELLMKGIDDSLVREVEAPEGPLCPVRSGADCIALRRGSLQTFPDSDAINSCAHLRMRDTVPDGGVCVPATFLGQSLGVLHVTTSAGDVGQDNTDMLVELTGLIAGRLGTLRTFDPEFTRPARAPRRSAAETDVEAVVVAPAADG
jgi:hypothetical protein